MKRTKAATGAVIATAILFGMVGIGVVLFIAVPFYVASYVWDAAPVVGGEWWPYIRITVTVIGAIVAFKVSLVVSYIMFGILGIGGAILGAFVDTRTQN